MQCPEVDMKRISVLGAVWLLAGCAGLMMDVKDADKERADVALKPSDQVKLAEPDVKAIEADFGKEDAAQVSELLKQDLKKELADKKVEVSADSDKVIAVKVTHYAKGCGFCRGFFPFFGLGDSAVDGEVELDLGGKHRKLLVSKTGQASGMAEMGDQTATNANYFATVVVARLTESPSDKGKDKDD
jgi:hypothetical protein